MPPPRPAAPHRCARRIRDWVSPCRCGRRRSRPARCRVRRRSCGERRSPPSPARPADRRAPPSSGVTDRQRTRSRAMASGSADAAVIGGRYPAATRRADGVGGGNDLSGSGPYRLYPTVPRRQQKNRDRREKWNGLRRHCEKIPCQCADCPQSHFRRRSSQAACAANREMSL